MRTTCLLCSACVRSSIEFRTNSLFTVVATVRDIIHLSLNTINTPRVKRDLYRDPGHYFEGRETRAQHARLFAARSSHTSMTPSLLDHLTRVDGR